MANNRLTIFLSLFSIMGAVSIAFFLWLSMYQDNMYLTEIKANEISSTTIGSKTFKHSVEYRFDDILFLSDIAAKNYDRTTGQFQLDQLTDIFLTLSRNMRVYSKMRLLTASGQELIRINHANGQSEAAPSSLLQNVSQRIFFHQALANDHRVYVAPFSLSIENNSLVVPYKPLLHILATVRDEQDKLIGYVAMSYLAEAIFRAVRTTMSGTVGDILLVNDAGYYILSPDPLQEWGFQLPGRQDALFQNDFPQAWQEIHAKDHGSFSSSAGLFTFKTIHIASRFITTHATGFDVESKDYWKLITLVPAKTLSSPWRPQTMAAGAGILMLFLVVAWLWAGASARRAQAASKLKKNEQQLKIIMDTAQDAIVLLDSRGIPIHWNPAAQRLFGYEFNDIKGSFFHDLICPENLLDRVHKGLDNFAQTGAGPIVDTLREVTARRGDGTTVSLELRVASIFMEDQWYSVGVARDISERKQSEANLHYEREFLKAVLEHISEAILVADSQGRIVLGNQAARTLFGIKSMEEQPEAWRIALHEKYDIFAADGITILTKESSPLERIMSGEHLVGEEIFLVSRHGDKRTITIGGRLLFDMHGHEMGAVLSLNDVTDLVNTRELARSAERAKSALLSRLGHEFKTPLNGILGMADLLLEDPLSDEQKDFVSEIRQSGNRLLRVLSMLIEYTTIESGVRPLNFQSVSLDHLLEDIELRWKHKVEQKGLVLSTSASTSPLPSIQLDPDCTNMILDQLLDNSLKFTHEGGISVHISVESTGTALYSVYISVIDTGIGIPPDLRDKVFDEFWQQDGSYTRRYQGLGMGLTLAQGLVRLMGGRIWTGDVERGCEMHVLLAPLVCSL